MKKKQNSNLTRVSSRIGPAIIKFYRRNIGNDFHALDLHASVERQCGSVAPASSDRILRLLRTRGLVNYTVKDRGQSLYTFLPVITS